MWLTGFSFRNLSEGSALNFRGIILHSANWEEPDPKAGVLVLKDTILQSFKSLRYTSTNQTGVQVGLNPKCASNFCKSTSKSLSCKQGKGTICSLPSELVVVTNSIKYWAIIYRRKIETLNTHTSTGTVPGLVGFVTVQHPSNIWLIFRHLSLWLSCCKYQWNCITHQSVSWVRCM